MFRVGGAGEFSRGNRSRRGVGRSARREPRARALAVAEMERPREIALLFLHEKRFEPAVGYAIDESMRVRIARFAALPILRARPRLL